MAPTPWSWCRSLAPTSLFLDVADAGSWTDSRSIEKVSSEHLPIVVFVTAHDRYALKAFETHALDYLLKPFTASRFHAALDRARLEVAQAGDHETHQRLIEVLDERRRARERRGSQESVPVKAISPASRSSTINASCSSRRPTSTGSSRAPTTPTCTRTARAMSSA